MKTKIFTKNEKGKIEFTEKELKALLDEIYNEGYNDGKSRSYIYTTPYTSKPWLQYGTWCTADDTITSSKAATTATTTTATTGDIDSTITIKGVK
jgi:hypothetical protein